MVPNNTVTDLRAPVSDARRAARAAPVVLFSFYCVRATEREQKQERWPVRPRVMALCACFSALVEEGRHIFAVRRYKTCVRITRIHPNAIRLSRMVCVAAAEALHPDKGWQQTVAIPQQLS